MAGACGAAFPAAAGSEPGSFLSPDGIEVYDHHQRTPPAAQSRGLKRAGLVLLHAAEPCWYPPRQTGRQYDDDETRPHVSRVAEACDGSSARELRLHLAAQPGLFKARRACRDRRQARLFAFRSDRPHRDDAQQGRRVSPFRVERLLVGLVAAHRRTHSSSAATSSSPACGHRGSTSSIPNRIPPRRRFTRSSSLRRCSKRPGTRGRTRSIAGRKVFTSLRSAAAARTAPMDRPASSSWTARHSRCSDGGKSIAVLKRSTMISGGTCHAITW